jgi:hypothetical protein
VSATTVLDDRQAAFLARYHVHQFLSADRLRCLEIHAIDVKTGGRDKDDSPEYTPTSYDALSPMAKFCEREPDYCEWCYHLRHLAALECILGHDCLRDI